MSSAPVSGYYKPMDPAVKEAWLAALRSGEYKQTVGTLHRTEANYTDEAGFCCLGVLCEVARAQGMDLITKDTSLGTVRYGDASKVYPDLDGGYPPAVVTTWANLDWRAGQTLAQLNDGGMTFDGIANWIEREI